jgi:hypothetical protein
MYGVQDAFGIVLVVVVVVAALVALASWLAGPSAYDQIGKGGLSLRDGSDRGVREDPPAVSAAVRDEEIRQMVEARNARRVRQGKEPEDVEAALRELQPPPAADPALATEVRQLVVARNARRLRQGKEPLDVEEEVARRLRDLQSG